MKKYNLNSSSLKTIQKNSTKVKSGIKKLDEIIGDLKTGEVTFINGINKIVSNIEKKICVDNYKAYKHNIIYIDGGMSFNPYGIAKYAVESEIDQRAVLEHIHISRVFTLFQLNTILQDKLEQKIVEYNPKILIIGKFLALYVDSEVSSNQVNIIMKNNLKKIKELAKKYEITVILSNLNSRVKLVKNVGRIIFKNVDQIVTIKQIGQFINFNFVKKDHSRVFSIIEKGQLRLSNFGMET
jgi:hypothetical protein